MTIEDSRTDDEANTSNEFEQIWTGGEKHGWTFYRAPPPCEDEQRTKLIQSCEVPDNMFFFEEEENEP